MRNFQLIASEWYGGKASLLYAYSCTGTILPGLAEEIEYCLSTAMEFATEEEISEMRSLLAEISE